MLPIPSAGEVALGFEFSRPADAERLADRLPPTLARHAAVALALVTSQLATERELAALRARDAEQTTFISTVAHELRTPLTGLRGYLELILANQVDDPAVERDFLERSRSIVGSMGELVGDLLELSRLESGMLGLEIGPFSVAEAGSQVAAHLLPIALERGIQLSTALPPRLRVASGDRRRVEQVLTNLAANALKFTPSGGTVEIEAAFDGPVAVMVVRDDGAGIPPEDRTRIFERFQRIVGHERVTGTGSACRSPATSPGRWAATSTSRPSGAPAPRSSSSCRAGRGRIGGDRGRARPRAGGRGAGSRGADRPPRDRRGRP
jgi:signal transduction histidine kinase